MTPQSVGYVLEADAWAALDTDYPGEGVVVAQIDTGVNDRHPNIEPRICDPVSFAAHPFGLCYAKRAPDAGPDGNEDQPRLICGAQPGLGSSLIGADTWNKAERLAAKDPVAAELIGRLRSGRGVVQETAQTSRLRYSAHGTACAGLIVGAPEQPKPDEGAGSAKIAKQVTLDDGDGPIPYWGVAPGARLLPIEISAQPRAEQLIMAFLYAWDKKVSVIHFPREVPDPWLSHQYYPGYGDGRYTSDDAKAAWDYFEQLFELVSRDIPIVCPAGNDGYDRSNLSGEYGSRTERRHRGRRREHIRLNGPPTLTTAEAATDNAVTIAAPSDDQEVYTRYQIRLDKEAPRWRDHNFNIHGGVVPQDVEFSAARRPYRGHPGPPWLFRRAAGRDPAARVWKTATARRCTPFSEGRRRPRPSSPAPLPCCSPSISRLDRQGAARRRGQG